jgi:hypothetical protein
MKTKKHLSLWVSFVLLIFVLGSCKKDGLKKSALNDAADKTTKQVIIPQAYPAGIGERITYYMNDGSTVVLQKVNNEYIFDGDIVLSANQLKYIRDHSSSKKLSIQSIIKNRSTFTANFNLLWPGGKVYYIVNNPINQATINQAISYWNSHTQIQLIPRTNQPNYVVFQGVPSQGAGSSQIGMIGGPQEIRLINNVDFGGVLHEIGHTVGLMHEQTRADRDLYINVNYNNINSDWAPQYQVYAWGTGYQTGTFDFNSIMLYPSDVPEARINNNPALQMTRLDGSEFYQQRYQLSAGDIAGVNYMYFSGLYARVRRVITDSEYSQFRTYQQEDIYVDFFSDAACTIPKVLDRSVRFYMYDTRQTYYDGNQGPSSTATAVFYDVGPGQNSYMVAGSFVEADMYFTYDGLTLSGSYNEFLTGIAGIGYVLKY